MATPVGSPSERLLWRCSRVVHAASTLLVLVQPYLHVFDTTSGKPVRAAMSALADEVTLCKKQNQLLPSQSSLRGARAVARSTSATGPSGVKPAPAQAPVSAAAGPSTSQATTSADGPPHGSAEHMASVRAKAADAVSKVLRRLAPSEWWARFRTEAAQGIEGAQDACNCGRNKAHTREVCASHRAEAYRRHLQHLLENASATMPEAILIAYDGVCDALLAGQPLDEAATAHLPSSKAVAGKRERNSEPHQAVPMEIGDGEPQPTAEPSPRGARKAVRSKRVRAQAAPSQVQEAQAALIGQVLQQLAELQRAQAAQAAALAAATAPNAYGAPPAYGARFAPQQQGWWR